MLNQITKRFKSTLVNNNILHYSIKEVIDKLEFNINKLDTDIKNRNLEDFYFLGVVRQTYK